VIFSPKQWTAGAPVIGAAPVSSGKPKRSFRLTIIRRLERSKFSYETKGNKQKYLAAKTPANSQGTPEYLANIVSYL
jgi:hypothetical protein